MKYRKKPDVIEAMQVRDRISTLFEVAEWIRTNGGSCTSRFAMNSGTEPFRIQTPEGAMTVNVGDWVIRGVAGEFYPVKPAIFEATYEPVEGGQE